VIDAQSQDELERVLSHYPLGGLRGAQRPQHGFVNDNWIVDTTAGRFFLKHRHPTLSEPAFVHAQHALTMWLRSGGFPAPELKRTMDGNTLCILDSECYEIQQYIVGTNYDHHHTAHLEEAARTLACYHSVVSSFAEHELCRHECLYTPRQIRENLSHLVRTWQATNDAESADLVACIGAQVEELAARFAEHGRLRALVIHGDYYADNLLFSGDRIVGVVDYDKSRWQARVVELAEALIYFGSPRPGDLKHLVYRGYPKWELLTPFLLAYCHNTPLVDAEAEAVPDYMQCIWLQMSLWRLRDRAKRQAEARGALCEVLALACWARDHREAMTEACRSSSRHHGSGAGKRHRARVPQKTPASERGVYMIKAIIFDFGRVISAPKPVTLFRAYEEELGLEPGRLNRIMFGSEVWEEVLVGRKKSDQYWQEIGPRLGLQSGEAIASFRQRYHADEAINEPVLEIIRRLRSGYKLGVVSNCPAGLGKWLADWRILELFDAVICSGDEGVVKPDPAIYQLALKRLAVRPEEAVFVDDTLGHVEAARALGLHGIHFTTPSALEAQLDQLLAAQGGLPQSG